MKFKFLAIISNFSFGHLCKIQSPLKLISKINNVSDHSGESVTRKCAFFLFNAWCWWRVVSIKSLPTFFLVLKHGQMLWVTSMILWVTAMRTDCSKIFLRMTHGWMTSTTAEATRNASCFWVCQLRSGTFSSPNSKSNAFFLAVRQRVLGPRVRQVPAE